MIHSTTGATRKSISTPELENSEEVLGNPIYEAIDMAVTDLKKRQSITEVSPPIATSRGLAVGQQQQVQQQGISKLSTSSSLPNGTSFSSSSSSLPLSSTAATVEITAIAAADDFHEPLMAEKPKVHPVPLEFVLSKQPEVTSLPSINITAPLEKPVTAPTSTAAPIVAPPASLPVNLPATAPVAAPAAAVPVPPVDTSNMVLVSSKSVELQGPLMNAQIPNVAIPRSPPAAPTYTNLSVPVSAAKPASPARTYSFGSALKLTPDPVIVQEIPERAPSTASIVGSKAEDVKLKSKESIVEQRTLSRTEVNGDVAAVGEATTSETLATSSAPSSATSVQRLETTEVKSGTPTTSLGRSDVALDRKGRPKESFGKRISRKLKDWIL